MLAVLVKATLIEADGAATPGQKSWANNILDQINPRGVGNSVLVRLLMENRAVPAATIQGVLTSDSSTQTQVNNFINAIIAEL
jgi:hypothetical protein